MTDQATLLADALDRVGLPRLSPGLRSALADLDIAVVCDLAAAAADASVAARRTAHAAHVLAAAHDATRSATQKIADVLAPLLDDARVSTATAKADIRAATEDPAGAEWASDRLDKDVRTLDESLTAIHSALKAE